MSGLSLFSADFTTHEYPTHIHDALLIAVTEAGGSEIRASGVPAEVHADRLLIVNPAEPHSSRMSASHRWRYRSFYFELPALDDIQSALGIDALPSFERSVVGDADLISTFYHLHLALEDGREDILHKRELLVGAMGTLVRRYSPRGNNAEVGPRDLSILRAAMDLLHDRFAERITLNDLAAHAGMTQFQLIGLFRKGVGMTPHAYLNQVRLGVARQRLRDRQPIADVAASCGFYDQAALSKHFKRCFGMTPLQFARAAAT